MASTRSAAKQARGRARLQSRKEALLEAAKELFAEYGYSETTFKKISERAGVALGLLTHHYGNKEKLFLASGLDVLANFQACLEEAVAGAANGFEAVMRFCKAYLDFSISPRSSWLVLVRCSPYSDMKTHSDRKQMDESFAVIHNLLADQIRRGVADGSLIALEPDVGAQVIISTLVGANRTVALTPYGDENLFGETLAFISRGIKK
ncbi:MAG: TetR/AcrR family transcriptional regulator [Desulfovibrio sp.]|nr:TetR/AcrR family transcriptional regulator [Desulfovibrio sp.]